MSELEELKALLTPMIESVVYSSADNFGMAKHEIAEEVDDIARAVLALRSTDPQCTDDGLRKASLALFKDMIIRAHFNKHENGGLVVEAGCGVWDDFCAALGNDADEVAKGLPDTDPQCVVVKELELRSALEGYEPSWAEGDNIAVTLISVIERSLDLDEAEENDDNGWHPKATEAYEATIAGIIERILSSISLRSCAEVKAEGAREALEKAANAMLKVPCETRDDEFITWVEAANFVRSQSSEGEG